MYGNHQGSQRTLKRSHSAVHFNNVADNQLDKKATMEADVKPIVNTANAPGESKAVGGDSETLERIMSTNEDDLFDLGDGADVESSGEGEDVSQKNTKPNYDGG